MMVIFQMHLCGAYLLLNIAYHMQGVYGSDVVTLKGNLTYPKQGDSIRLSCLVREEEDNPIIWYYQSTSTRLGTCYRSLTGCNGVLPGYVITANQYGAYLDINSLNRSLHEGVYFCAYRNGNGTDYQSTLSIVVYAIPHGLVYMAEPITDTDLIVSSVTQQCKTNGCTYPPPIIKWFYRDEANLGIVGVYIITNGSASFSGSCLPKEDTYTSTLHIAMYTTWTDNTDKVVRFFCGIEYSESSRNIYSLESGTVRFAVQVTEIELQQNNQSVPDTSFLNVTSWEPIILTCVPGISRPAPTIDWYIGADKISSGTNQSFTFTPVNRDHDKLIFCQAYNTNANKQVESRKPKLYVKVHPSVFQFLSHRFNSVQLVLLILREAQSRTMTCTTICRPEAVISWWKNDVNITYIANSSTYDQNVTTGTLVYTGNRLDNGHTIVCKAWNGYGSNQTSQQIFLDIRYAPAVPPTISSYSNGSVFSIVENTPQTLDCIVTGGNPLASLSWNCFGLAQSSNTTNQTVTSTIFLTVNRNQDHQQCQCVSTQEVQGNRTVFVVINVLYGASISNFTAKNNNNVIMENDRLELLCQVDSNPYSDIFLYHDDKLQFKNKENALKLSYLKTAECIDAGKYTCHANNSIMNGNTVFSDLQIMVLCSPRLDDQTNVSTVYYKGLNDNITLEVYVIAYPEPTHIRWYHRQNGTDMWQRVAYQPPSSGGLFSKIVIHLISQSDFGYYMVSIGNDLGNFSQIYSVILESKDRALEGKPKPFVFPVGAVAGGISGAIVAVVLVILVTIFLRRRVLGQNENGDHFTRELHAKEKPESGLVDNTLYDSSGPLPGPSTSSGAAGAEYAVVVKNTRVDNASNLYTQVDKKNNKGKGDIHENSHIFGQRTSKEKEYANSKDRKMKEASDDNVYENPGAASSIGSLVSKECLHYADLMLDPPTTKNGKPFIRGLEDRTVYAKIAYGKRGQPLPDSDNGQEKNTTGVATEKADN